MNRKFQVVLEQDPDGGYSVHVPALPGCASQGDTLEEALRNIQEAIELYVWSLKDDGLPIPELDQRVIVQEVEIVA
ncbi:MAG: type II toxin-antitoxin system HicB family antitoxin [Acidobacteria bacterium]|nr:type II toxin-antitoxin system HicB family antitoxin [Acidobacteriota bacterium]MCZ6491616.1 type II toxin-antitoxin system HicB family antitoxin [Acidobacteriota bacterium]MCZ6753470.1 type II toxin-antitoxin system HicB family antitoxin [Acidobacteriota bacterium]